MLWRWTRPVPACRLPAMTITLADDIAAVYVLNLRRRSDRMEAFTLKAREAGLTDRLEPVRIEAVDGRRFPRFHPTAIPTESAACMGHRYIWGLALAHEAPVLIFEDDAVFCRTFASRLREPLELPDNTDILQLGMSWLRLHAGDAPLREVKSGYGLFGYVLFPRGAEKLLQLETMIPLAPADHYSRPRIDLKVFIPCPTWVTVAGEDSDIRHRAPAVKRLGRHFEDMQSSPALPTTAPVESSVLQ